MVTSSIGWSELPYARLPFPLDGSAVLTGPDILRQPYGDHQLLFISGVRSDDDVMRGEECELIGIYSDQASRLGRNVVALLPGTHSKAALICDAKMVQFHTFLTGELFDLLCRHSILRHSVASPTSSQEPLDSYFDNGVLRGAAQGSLASLFSVRGQALLQHLNPEHCHHYLSGLLIGDELAALRKLFPAPAPLLLCARGSLQVPYARALSLLGEGGRVECAAPDTAELSASLGHWLVFSRFRRG
jgi:2-dehydro-3-deoxygalactonokinase